jgi:hypothetical protein
VIDWTKLEKEIFALKHENHRKLKKKVRHRRTLFCVHWILQKIQNHDVSSFFVVRIIQGSGKSLPCSFCRRHMGPSGHSGLSATLGSRRPFFRSRIHQSLSPYRSTSAAHILQIRWRGASRPGSGPGGTLWTSTNRSSSISGANLRGCDRICCTVCKKGEGGEIFKTGMFM